jgi:ABC-type sugar transport system ATPase subunit
MLEVDGVVKRFGATKALDRVSFRCQEGEFVVILGPPGAGKSTTLRVVAGLLRSEQGDVRFRGTSLRNIRPEKRNFSMVFENYALYSHKTVYENLAFPLEARGVDPKEIRRRVDKMAGVLRIAEMLDRRPGFLSGGQRQRVALGRALIREAFVYLLDEPISHLDARLRLEIRTELKALCADLGAIVLHVTHDSREAMALGDSLVVLDHGRVMQQGSPEQVYNSPANEFVAGFFGDPPMSFADVDFAEDQHVPILKLSGTRGAVVLNAELSHVIRERKDSRLRIAVRASQVPISLHEKTKQAVPGEIFVVEPYGYRTVITVKVGESLIRVVPSEGRWRLKETVWLDLNGANVHLFADSKAIYHPASTTKQDSYHLSPTSS